MNEKPALFHRFFGPDATAGRGVLWPRWLFLRGLGVIFFSAFYSLAFQIKGLIGARGILPAAAYLQEVARVLPGVSRFWRVPTLLWIDSGDGVLTALVWTGLIASVLLVLNVWPRLTIGICLACFLSFIGAAQDFASYQSDGMLLEAGFLSLFFAPRGVAAGARERPAAVARQPLPAPLGVVPDLFRIGRGEAAERRRAVAASHRDGPLLRERSAPLLARLVRAAVSSRTASTPRPRRRRCCSSW